MPQSTTYAHDISHWNIEQICESLDQQGFAIIDSAYQMDFFHHIRQECLQHLAQFREANIQNGRIDQIRSDHILWINPDLPIAYQHIQALQSLAQQLNQIFFLGIKSVEAHFACYHAGEFYAQHRDNPHQKNHRALSTVFYLQEQWQDNWGGELHLQDSYGQWQKILPQPNRLALFKSDLLHEVLPATQQRLSITAWLRTDQEIF